MLCPHCGADEPEIKIGIKTFCSICGFPLGKDIVYNNLQEPVLKNKTKDELSIAFSKIPDILDESKKIKETSYKSSDLTFIKKQPHPSSDITPQKEDKIKAEKLKIDKEERSESTTSKEEPQTSLPKEPPKEDQVIEKETPSLSPDNSEEKIIQLSATKRLLDILEKSTEEKKLKKEKEETKKIYEGAERLLDILKDIPEEPESSRYQKDEKKSEEKEEKALIKSPLTQKEITSPLERLEIPSKGALPLAKKDKPRQTDLNKPSIAENAIEVDKSSAVTSNFKPSPKPSKKTRETVTEPTHITSGLLDNKDLEKSPEEPSLKSPLENLVDNVPEPPQKIDLTKSPGKADKDVEEELPDEIHNLGDKSGHIDHWEEEEVKQIDISEINSNIKEKHPLTSYFENILEKKKEKSKGKKEKPKKKKKKRNHKTLKILFAFLVSVFVVLIIVLFIISTEPRRYDIQKTKREALEKINFEFIVPKYIPKGFTESLPILYDSNSLSITYSYSPDKKKQITLKETSNPLSEKELENYVKSQSQEYEVESLKTSKIYYVPNQATFVTGKIWITIKSNFDITKEELKKIAESFL